MRILALISTFIFFMLLICLLFLAVYLTNIYHPFSDNGSGRLVLVLFFLLILPVAGLISSLMLVVRLFKLKGMNRLGLDYPFTEYSQE